MADKGIKDKVEGEFKDKLGGLMGDKSKQAEGVAQKAVGKAKDFADDAKKTAEGLKEKAEDKIEEAKKN